MTMTKILKDGTMTSTSDIFDNLPMVSYTVSDKSFVYFGSIYELTEIIFIYENLKAFAKILYVEHILISGQSTNLRLEELNNSIYAGEVSVSIYDLKNIEGHIQIITLNSSRHQYDGLGA